MNRIDTVLSTASLGYRSFDRAKILLSFLVTYFVNKFSNRSMFFRHRISFGNKEIRMVLGNFSDYMLLKEIFVDEIYALDALDPKAIFDIGANVGLSSLYFSVRFPGAQVYSFEPTPSTFSVLKMNVKNMPNISAFQYAIASIDGNMKFYTNPSSSISASVKKRSEEYQEIEVVAKKLDTIRDELGLTIVDILKCDVEGAEYDIFAAVKDIRSYRIVVGELHLDLCDKTEEEFRALFLGREYQSSQITRDRSIFIVTENEKKS